jgi:hypothetical protein
MHHEFRSRSREASDRWHRKSNDFRDSAIISADVYYIGVNAEFN